MSITFNPLMELELTKIKAPSLNKYVHKNVYCSNVCKREIQETVMSVEVVTESAMMYRNRGYSRSLC